MNLARLFHRGPATPPHQHVWVVKQAEPYQYDAFVAANAYGERMKTISDTRTRVLRICRDCGEADVLTLDGSWKREDLTL